MHTFIHGHQNDPRDEAGTHWPERLLRAVTSAFAGTANQSLVNEKFTDALERELLGETARARYR